MAACERKRRGAAIVPHDANITLQSAVGKLKVMGRWQSVAVPRVTSGIVIVRCRPYG